MPQQQNSRTLWVVFVAVAAVVLAILLVVALLPRGGDSPTPPPPTTPTPDEPVTTAAPEPSDTTTEDPGTDEPDPVWGGFPPGNLNELRDLSGAAFPQTLGGAFELTGTNDDYGSIMADYDDIAQGRSLIASLWSGHMMYATIVDGMDEPNYHGDAVCGQAVDGEWVDTHCVMAGSDSVLQVTISDADTTPEEMAAVIQELYTSL